MGGTSLVELEQEPPAEIAARVQAIILAMIYGNDSKGIRPEGGHASLPMVRAQVYRLPASGEHIIPE